MRTRNRISDEAVRTKTGKSWKEWFSLLDGSDASAKSHKEIAEYLNTTGVPGWWAQMITVEYEQECGLRKAYQTADGYSASASRTFAVPVGVLYRHWSDEKLRKKWLSEKILVRKAMKEKSMRVTWPDGTNVEVYFSAKGDDKSAMAVQHGRLAGAAGVARVKKQWHAAFDRLKAAIS